MVVYQYRACTHILVYRHTINIQAYSVDQSQERRLQGSTFQAILEVRAVRAQVRRRRRALAVEVQVGSLKP